MTSEQHQPQSGTSPQDHDGADAADAHPDRADAQDGARDPETDTGSHDDETTEDDQDDQDDQDEANPRIIVTSPSGLGIAEADGDQKADPTAAVEEPAKVMRLGSMIKQLLEEVRSAPLDEAARDRLARIHEQSLKELESGLSEELVGELHRIALPFDHDRTPSDAELRIAKAQLVGWLEGLFHGIQTALVAQQMAAQSQLSQMRKALPPGVAPGQMPPGLVVNRPSEDSEHRGTGQYL